MRIGIYFQKELSLMSPQQEEETTNEWDQTLNGFKFKEENGPQEV